MNTTITIVQIILGVLLSLVILMQNRSSGIGSTWGSAGMSYHSKRGLEVVLLRTTIVLSILFVSISVGAVLLPA